MLSLSDIVNVKVGIGRGVFEAPGATVIGGKKPSFNLEILKLFANGEQGFFYDPNDLSTMYQDANGTVPVTAVGQVVRLVLDKSKGLVLGSNLIPNGSFSSDTAWGKGAGWTIADGVARFDGSAAFSNLGNTTPSSINGKWLRVELDLSNVGTLVTQVRVLASGVLAATIPVSGAGKYSAMVLGGSAPSIGIQTQATSGANYAFTLDNVSVKEAFGNHAYQTTSAARPILRKNTVTGANYLEFDGSDDFLQTNNIDFTVTDKVSLFTGVTKLADNTQIIAELSQSISYNAGSFYLVSGNDSGGNGYVSLARGSLSASSGKAARNFTYLAPDVAVLSVKHDISGNLSSMRRNGVIGIDGLDAKGTGNFGNYPLFIGRRGGTSLPFNGHIYGLIGIGKLTSDSETAVIEKELAKRVGVTLSV